MYAQRRPAPYEQTTETKIAKHSNDLKRQKRGEIKIRHRQRDTTSVVSSVNSNVSRALIVRKPVKPQHKRRRQTNLTEPSDTATTSPQQLVSIVPAPPAPTTQDHQEPPMSSASQDQTEGRKRRRTQFYGFIDADISLTSSLASTSSAKPKKRKTKKVKKTENSVVALIQDAEDSRVPSPRTFKLDRPHHQIPESGTTSMSKNVSYQSGTLKMKFSDPIKTLQTLLNSFMSILLCIRFANPMLNVYVKLKLFRLFFNFSFQFVPVFAPRIHFLMCVMLMYLLQFGSFACYNCILYSLCESTVISFFVHLI